MNPRLLELGDKLRNPRNLSLLGGLVLAFALAFTLTSSSSVSEYQILLEEAPDPGELLRLADLFLERGIPHRIEDGGHTLRVGRAHFNEAQQLIIENGSGNGISQSSTSGQGFLGLGISGQESHGKIQRRKESDLARTLAMYPSIKFARVHLNLPEADAFGRRGASPSASIFLRLRSPRALPCSQAKALRSLIAAAIKGMDPKRVVLADNLGTDYETIFTANARIEPLKQAKARMGVVKDFEVRTEDKLLRHLEPLFGEENLRISVSAVYCSKAEQEEHKKHPVSVTVSRDESGVAKVCFTSVAVGVNSNILPDAFTDGVKEQVYEAISDALGYGPGFRKVLHLRAHAFVSRSRRVRIGNLVAKLPPSSEGSAFSDTPSPPRAAGPPQAPTASVGGRDPASSLPPASALPPISSAAAPGQTSVNRAAQGATVPTLTVVAPSTVKRSPFEPVAPKVPQDRAGGEFGLPLGIFMLMLGSMGLVRYSQNQGPCRKDLTLGVPLDCADGLRSDPDLRRDTVMCWAEDDPEFAARILVRLLREDRND